MGVEQGRCQERNAALDRELPCGFTVVERNIFDNIAECTIFRIRRRACTFALSSNARLSGKSGISVSSSVKVLE